MFNLFKLSKTKKTETREEPRPVQRAATFSDSKLEFGTTEQVYKIEDDRPTSDRRVDQLNRIASGNRPLPGIAALARKSMSPKKTFSIFKGEVDQPKLDGKELFADGGQLNVKALEAAIKAKEE